MRKRKRSTGDAAPTRAVEEVHRRGINVELLSYEHGGHHQAGFGRQAAIALGLPDHLIYKTIMVTVDGSGYAVLVSCERRVSLKKVARALNAKHAEVMSAPAAQHATGYVVGGISPFAQQRPHPVVIDAEVMGLDAVVVSAGRRGMSLRIAVPDLIAATRAIVADIHSDEVVR